MSAISGEITWLGRGGQGAFTSSRLLGEALVSYGNLWALAFPSFGPERRGAPVFAYVKFANRQVRDRSRISAPNFFVILDETLFSSIKPAMVYSDTVFVVNTERSAVETAQSLNVGVDRVRAIPAGELSLHIYGESRVNTVMLGATCALMPSINEAWVLESLRMVFKGKNLERNESAFMAGRNLVKER